MRPDIIPGGTFPDYALPDHTSTVRTLSELQGRDPMIPHTLVLKPGLVIHSIYNGYWFWGRPSVDELRRRPTGCQPRDRPRLGPQRSRAAGGLGPGRGVALPRLEQL